MKKLLSLSILLLLTSVVFSSLIDDIVSSYASQVIEGHRIVVEQDGSTTRIRYENILRNGYNEIVKIVAPQQFEWSYIGKKTYVVFGNEMRLSPATIVDAEQSFIKDISIASTIVSTSTAYYHGMKSCKLVIKSPNATYIAVVLEPSLIIGYLKIERKKGSITIDYDRINLVPLSYFNAVIRRFKIIKKPPSSMEIYVWKLISKLDNANVTSISINNVSIAIVSGKTKKFNRIIVAYVFRKGDSISTGDLVAQFKVKGFTALTIKQDDVNVVLATKMKLEQLKEWVNTVFK